MNPISHTKALDFMKAGKATMTIQSKVSGKHFTFHFKRPKHDETKHSNVVLSKDLPIWVSVKTSNDNAYGSIFLGTIFGNRYYHSKKSRAGEDALSVVSFKYWFRSLVLNKEDNLNLIDLYHTGNCMKCGRKLTTPDSVEQGIGPVCSDWLERQKIVRDRKIRQQLEVAGIDVKTMSSAEKIQLMGFFKGSDKLLY